jgi:type I restriction enzyme R subunit
MSRYDEDTLVQQTTAEYLESQLDWKAVYAFNTETFGPESLLGRSSDRDVVLTRSLGAKLRELNPGLPDAAYDDAVRQVTTTVTAQTLIATNREKYAQVRDGVQATFRNANGEVVKQRLMLIDFEDPDKNEFLCVRELWVRGDLYRKRADIVGFVNGIPLLFMECKAMHRNLQAAFEENFSDYKDTVPHLLHHNALVIFGNGQHAKVGSITAKWKHFHDWKRLHEGDPGVVDNETLLKGICDRRNFLDLVENFILFDDSRGETQKIVAHNHQFLGVNQAIEAVKNRKARQGKLGVFWHTQGSGKSYSIAMFTRKVHRKLGGNFTFVMLTDRDDLDTQLYKTFAGCGIVDNDKDPCRPGNGDDLRAMLRQQKSYVFSTIQKFNKDELCTERDDVIVVTDEAHRTQYGTLALNVRNGVPNGNFIGFTGTPLFKDDEITRRVFGRYVSVYDFQRAVEDQATVPLYYDARGEKLGVAIGDLNERIAAKLAELEDEYRDDINVRKRLEQELKRDYHVITAEKRLTQVARDFVQHYSTAWESGKAMFVCIDKLTCVKMHGLITKFWDERIAELEVTLGSLSSRDDITQLQKQIAWMKETRAVVIVSEEQGEVAKFKTWDMNIEPHRRLMKEGIDLPESMRARPEYRNKQRLDLDEAFKADEHPFRVAIVCAMWLTGFDVPSLATLYLDKPLKAHTLMQAIARANRMAEGKNNGLIVDYCGILKHLRKALATFAGAGGTSGGDGTGEGDEEKEEDKEVEPAKPDEVLLGELAESIVMARKFLTDRGASLDAVMTLTGFPRNAAIVACMEAANDNDETRKRFEIICREVFSKFKACITVDGINAFRAERDAINFLYKLLNRETERADISGIMRQLHKVVDEAIETTSDQVGEASAVYDISKVDFDRLRQEFTRNVAKKTATMDLKQAIEKKLKRLMMQNPLGTNFQQHYENIVAEYNREKNRVTIEKSFEAFVKFAEKLNEEDRRAIREGLDKESLAIFDLLMKPEISAAEIKRIKKVAVELLATLKTEKLKVDQWREKEATRDAVRQAIKDFLWSDQTGLPADYDQTEVEGRAEEVYRHVYRVYPTIPSPYFERDVVA